MAGFYESHDFDLTERDRNEIVRLGLTPCSIAEAEHLVSCGLFETVREPHDYKPHDGMLNSIAVPRIDMVNTPIFTNALGEGRLELKLVDYFLRHFLDEALEGKRYILSADPRYFFAYSFYEFRLGMINAHWAMGICSSIILDERRDRCMVVHDDMSVWFFARRDEGITLGGIPDPVWIEYFGRAARAAARGSDQLGQQYLESIDRYYTSRMKGVPPVAIET